MIVIILVAGLLSTPITPDKMKALSCDSDDDDMTNSTYFMAALTVVVALVFIIFFKPKCLRMEAERKDTFIAPSITSS